MFWCPITPYLRNIRKINVAKFSGARSRVVNNSQDLDVGRRTETELLVNSTMSRIIAACNALPQICVLADGWNCRSTKEFLRLRRVAQHARGQDEVIVRSTKYKRAKKEMLKALENCFRIPGYLLRILWRASMQLGSHWDGSEISSWSRSLKRVIR